MKKPFVLLTTAVSALAVAGVVGVGVAAADPTPSPTRSSTSSASPTSSPSSTATPGQPGAPARKHRDLTRRALHGEVTLGAQKPHVVTFQRGTVSAADGGSLTVRSTDGFVGTYVVGPRTKVRVAKKPAAIADVAVGDRVRVRAVKDGQGLVASRVVVRKS